MDQTDFSMLHRIGRALTTIGNEIEALGVQLCADPAVASRHMSILQSIDLIAQQQHGLAKLMLAADFETGMEEIGLEILHLKLAS